MTDTMTPLLAATIPLDILERLVQMARMVHPSAIAPDQREEMHEAIALVEAEIAEQRRLAKR